MSKNPTIWVLADNRAGNVNQALGIAEALGFRFTIKKIKYNSLVKLPNSVRGKSFIGVDKKSIANINNDYPDIIISAGRRLLPIARKIKKLSQGQSKIIHLMWPGKNYDDVDLLIVPKHDEITQQNNITNIIGAPNRINKKALTKAKHDWKGKLKKSKNLDVAIIIGGSTKHAKFSLKYAKELCEKLEQADLDKDLNFWVTTSRRTDSKIVDFIKSELHNVSYFYDYRISEDENPYFGFLALSDIIVVTGDSVSMCSEACSTGKPVYIFSPKGLVPAKMQRLHQELYNQNCAQQFDGSLEKLKNNRLEETKRIASFINKQFGFR